MEPDKLVDKFLDNLQEEIRIKERFKEKLATEVDEGVALIAALVGGPYVIKGAQAAYKNLFDREHKKCKNLPKEDYDLCMKKTKFTAFKAQLAKLGSGKSACQKAKDPQKCIQQVQAKIQNTKFKMKILQGSIRDSLARRKTGVAQ